MAEKKLDLSSLINKNSSIEEKNEVVETTDTDNVDEVSETTSTIEATTETTNEKPMEEKKIKLDISALKKEEKPEEEKGEQIIEQIEEDVGVVSNEKELKDIASKVSVDDVLDTMAIKDDSPIFGNYKSDFEEKNEEIVDEKTKKEEEKNSKSSVKGTIVKMGEGEKNEEEDSDLGNVEDSVSSTEGTSLVSEAELDTEGDVNDNLKDSETSSEGQVIGETLAEESKVEENADNSGKGNENEKGKSKKKNNILIIIFITLLVLVVIAFCFKAELKNLLNPTTTIEQPMSTGSIENTQTGEVVEPTNTGSIAVPTQPELTSQQKNMLIKKQILEKYGIIFEDENNLEDSETSSEGQDDDVEVNNYLPESEGNLEDIPLESPADENLDNSIEGNYYGENDFMLYDGLDVEVPAEGSEDDMIDFVNNILD